MDERGREFVVLDKGTYTYNGYLDFGSEFNPIAVTFLPFKTQKEACGMFTPLLRNRNPKLVRMIYSSITQYEDEWLIVVENFETIESYFTKKMNDWKSNHSQGNMVTDKANWFKYIEEDFTKVFQDVIRLCSDGVDDRSCNSIYANPKQCLVITSRGPIKFLPIVDGNEDNDADFEKLTKFMSRIIGLPFDTEDVMGDPDFNMPQITIICGFLGGFSSNDRNYMGPNFLLGAPFGWSLNDKYRFIMTLDCLIKRSVILEEKLRTHLEFNQELMDWKSFLVGYPVLFKICDFPRSSGGEIESYRSVVDIVRFCSKVYWDYNDAATKCLSRRGIERELSSAIPNLYVSLFESLILYARSLLEREPIFDKSIISEGLL